jgi:hypothetical protein
VIAAVVVEAFAFVLALALCAGAWVYTLLTGAPRAEPSLNDGGDLQALRRADASPVSFRASRVGGLGEREDWEGRSAPGEEARQLANGH